jgi:hypothetical protein
MNLMGERFLLEGEDALRVTEWLGKVHRPLRVVAARTQ